MSDAIAWSLVHSLWQDLGIALSAALALWLLRRATAQARYVAACTALALMLAAPVATFVRLRELSAPPSAGFFSSVSTATAAARLLAVPEHAPIDRWLAWITALWLLGVAVLCARWILAWAWLQFRIRSSGSSLTARLQAIMEPLHAELRVQRRVILRSADWLASPAVTGWLRPVLLLPASALTGLDPDQLAALIAHELAHVRRHDYLVNLIQTAIETLLFYHPAVWWISRRIRAERENCCDDIALAVSGGRMVYANALLKLEETRGVLPEMAVAAGGASLKNRIRRILYPRENPGSAWPAGALMLLLAALFLWGGQKIVAQSTEMPDMYAQWLSQDVVYIISPVEHRAFERLRSDPERDHFIAQFWQVRNPHPEDPAHNAVKDEHYRRIGYANRRFAEPPTAGWQTDRGMIYIIYGPPDEIETHSVEHFEEWLYHNVPSVGRRIFRFRDGKLGQR
ncbi:MAG TPA: M56 family metallopeptidase [Bryobacteraceae bacterium]|nr:M56 family metallopeptidase [Bryobacteraceae bacterium]